MVGAKKRIHKGKARTRAMRGLTRRDAFSVQRHAAVAL